MNDKTVLWALFVALVMVFLAQAATLVNQVMAWF